MWFTLFLAVVASVVVLYAPGYLFARSLSIARFASVAVAPLFSVFAFVVLGIVLFEVGATCSGPAVLAMATALGLAAWAAGKGVTRAMGARCPRELLSLDDASGTWKTAALYVAAACAVVFVVFVLVIDGPESFSRAEDTTVHFSIVRSFLDTGTFSTLHAHSYPEQMALYSFYPSAWHVVTALVASLFGNAVTIAGNATVIAFIAVVFPLGLCLLFFKLFSEDRRVVRAGVLFTVAFSGFPWCFVMFGQLLPNLTSFVLIPATLATLMGVVDDRRTSAKVRLALVVCVGLGAIVFAQPNGAFTFGIWAVLYGASRALYPAGASVPCVTSKRVMVAIGIVAVACAVWAALYCAPFLQNVVQYSRESFLSPAEALIRACLFMFTEIGGGVQPFLSVMVLLGVLRTCKDRRYLWLSVAFALSILMYVVDASTDGVLRHVLTGFWYTDYFRTAAMAALFAIPLAALGFVQAVDVVGVWCAKALKAPATMRSAHLSAGILTAMFLTCQFFPLQVEPRGIDSSVGLMEVRRVLALTYSQESVLTREEDEFVKKVLQTIPKGALVINVPRDGSCWSYGVEGLNVYFRRSADSGRGGDEESALLRMRLRDVASFDEVRRMVDELGARYLLMLDERKGEDRTVFDIRYQEENWVGIESIDEQTPGFSLVLSEDDMRLYEIVG